MQKKLLLTLGLCCSLNASPTPGSDNKGFVTPRGSQAEKGSWGWLGDVDEYFDTRKDKGSNASLARWVAVVLASTGNPLAERAGKFFARVPEMRGVLGKTGMANEAKALISFFLFSQELPVTEGATDLQKSTGQLMAQLQQGSMFVPDNRGTLRFNTEQFSALRRDPDFQATTNALLYAISGELGVTMLGGGDGLVHLKDLLLPLILFRSRYGRYLPGTMRFAFENTMRFLGKKTLGFMTGGDDKSAKELLTLCADTLTLVGLVSSKTVKHMDDKKVKLDKLFDEWISHVRGKASGDSHKLLNSAKDCFVHMGEAAYPRSMYSGGLRGAMDIMEISAPPADMMGFVSRKLMPMYGPNAVYLGQPNSEIYQKQLDGFAADLRVEIAGLESERERSRVLLQERSPLLGKLIG